MPMREGELQSSSRLHLLFIVPLISIDNRLIPVGLNSRRSAVVLNGSETMPKTIPHD